MKNPNAYNDDLWLDATLDAAKAIGRLWEAGGDVDDIMGTIESGLENASGLSVSVSVTWAEKAEGGGG